MRLAFIFLMVLASSVLLTSMAAWGITYGTSFSRVTSMSSEFTELSHGVLNEFGSFVRSVIQGNKDLVNNILTQQQASGEAQMQQTKGDMIKAIGTLVNYTTNATVQSQLQMNQVVDTFAGLMGSVVSEFRTLTASYAAQVRASLAVQVSSALSSVGQVRVGSLLRFLLLQDLGVLNLTRTPWDTVGLDDCNMLGAACATLQDLSDMEQITVALASGRYYNCTSFGGSINVFSKNGSVYNEDVLTWLPYDASVPAYSQKSMKQRCMTESPGLVQRVGQGCLLPQNCRCGNDQHCEPWFQEHVNDTFPQLSWGAFGITAGGAPYVSCALSLMDPGSGRLGAVVSIILPFAYTDYVVNHLGAPSTTLIVSFADDPTLSMSATSGRKCAANETPPGDHNLPFWSALRSCDPNVRWVAQWTFQNYATAVQSPKGLENAGIVWDLTYSGTGWIVVGAQLAEINGPIDASDARATSQLSAVRAQQLSQVEASGTATRDFVAAVGRQNIANAQALEASFFAQIQRLENTSRAAVAASQQSSSAHSQELMDAQTTQIDALKAKHLTAMSATAGWTIGVVLAILFAVLLTSASGTIKVTVSLLGIIDLMENAAEMKVENLEVPQNSAVKEVARIQTAFQVLILRLAEYKSYIPAGLFEQDEPEPAKTKEGGAGSDRESTSHRGSSHCLSAVAAEEKRSSGVLGASGLHQLQPSAIQVRTASTTSTQVGAGRRPGQSSKKNVVVLAVNVQGFMDVLTSLNESNSKVTFNNYIAAVHEAVSQYRGNIDCLLGDQVFVTFNAHIPCSDSAGAAMAAALEMRSKLQLLGDNLKFQIGLSFGPVFAGSVGYTKFKAMVTVGSPMKVAGLLARLPQFESGAVLVDPVLEEKAKFAYKLRPVELVHIPHLKSFVNHGTKKQRIFAVLSKKEMQDNEWMYQLHEGAAGDENGTKDWAETFEQMVAAKSVPEGQQLLQQFLAQHPTDAMALRLKDRLPLWVPGLGAPL